MLRSASAGFGPAGLPGQVVAEGGPAGGAGAGVALLLLLGTESGVPIPIPADLLMLAIGAAVTGGSLPWWLAVLTVQIVGVVGTTSLLLAASGPGAGLVRRFGPRLGLSGERLSRIRGTIERRGRPALVLGRATPGLRTVTVVAAGSAGLSARRVLAPLLVGSTLFLQGHLLLGMALGPVLRTAFDTTSGRTALATVLVVLAAVAVLLRRRRRVPAQAWAEGICPVCQVMSAGAADRDG